MTVVDVSPLLVLLIGVIVVLSLFIGLAGVALAASSYARRTDQRRTAARKRVRQGLFDRVDDSDPDWSTWVDTLSSTERRQLAEVVERYLRTMSGSGREPFLEVAAALEMGARANRRLDHPDSGTRLRALARLTVLDYPVDEQRLLETSLEKPRTRAAVARLLYERRDEFPGHRALGTGLLIWAGQEPLDVWGLETLVALNTDDPSALLSMGFWSLHCWTTTVTVQVCTVLQDCRPPRTSASHEWVLHLLDHENPRIRAAAIRALTLAGHRDDIRARIPFHPLVTDEDPGVRRSTYQVLAAWGDPRSKGLLEWAIVDEDDERAQLLATRALASLEESPDANQPGWPDATWKWVKTEREVTRNGYQVTEGVIA